MTQLLLNMDRTMAFEKSIKENAQARDFIVLMGMGHENYPTVISLHPVTSDNEFSRLTFNTKLT